jgi:competence protein ComEC
VVALLVAGAAMATAGLRADAVRAGPLGALASEGASVHLSGQVAGDPVGKAGTFAPYTLVPLTVSRVTARGLTTLVRSPVLLIGDRSWLTVNFGEQVEVFGRLQVPDGPELAAVVIASGSPRVTGSVGWVFRSVARVRDGLTEAATPLPAAQAALLPALVDGDVSTMPDQTTADFKTTGLTHLLAVSGSNLTLVLGFVLLVARWARLRGYALGVIGAVAVVLFVLLARPQPSVLRAAAMGLVGLLGMSSASSARGVRVLSVAVIVLVALDPWLARSIGFILSTLATAGILVLGPSWRDRLSRWMPRFLAEAIAVPLAAQVVCTPVIAAISGQVSLVAVAANIAVAPAVGPATVASLLAGLAAMMAAPAGHLAGRVAGVPLWWIVWVADRGAHFAGASLAWGTTPTSLVLLAGLCGGLVVVLPLVLSRRLASLAVSAVLVTAVLHPPGPLAWPPEGWVMVMCDVGQGDGLVLNAGHGAALVVDTGPDPALMSRCLRPLGIRQVPLVILTHFHADHVDGLSAVLGHYPVGGIEVSPFDQPADRHAQVMASAAADRVPVRVGTVGERGHIGALRWLVLGPPAATASGVGDGGSGPNNASIILLLRVHGIRILLAGDAEPEEEDAILAQHPDLRVDVLKEPHHGSAAFDPAFLEATGAAVSLISVGAHNVYGHPAPQTLSQLSQLGMRVYRTDQDGAIAVVPKADHLDIVTQR